MNQLLYLRDVVTLRLDEEKCVGCGMCLMVCPRAVLSLRDSTVQIVNRDACMECGACARNCPSEAFTVRAGVGCAAAVINSVLGKKKTSCCSVEAACCGDTYASGCSTDTNQTSCC